MPTRHQRQVYFGRHGVYPPRGIAPTKRNAVKENARNKRLRNKVRDRIHKLKTAPCMDCGGAFDPVCMDFDHRPGEPKLFDIASVSGKPRSWDVVLAEIAKCDLVCSNCHRLRTHRQRNHADTCARVGHVQAAELAPAPPPPLQIALDLKPP